MRVLVTGGAGFIGSHVVDRLRAHGHEPRIYDLVPSPYHEPGEVDTVVGDLLDVEAVGHGVRGCDAIIHLAAVSDVNDVVANPTRAELVNTRGTNVLLEAARKAQITRVLYASTIWVYGNTNGHGAVDEDTPLQLPAHLYTATKLAGEMYCRSYEELYGLEPTILRFGIPHGPRSRPTTVVAAFVARALDGKALKITGDGTQARRFVYVEDLAEGVVAALVPAAAGRIYNLVGAESTTVRAIADTVREFVADVPIVHVPSRPADLRGGEISGSRASAELGWRAETPFTEGVRRYVDWVKATAGTPSSATASRIDGSAAAVRRQEPRSL